MRVVNDVQKVQLAVADIGLFREDAKRRFWNEKFFLISFLSAFFLPMTDVTPGVSVSTKWSMDSLS